MTRDASPLAAAAASTIAPLSMFVPLLALGQARLRRRVAALQAEFQALKAEVAAATGIGVRAAERLPRLDQLSSQMNERLGQLELRGEGRRYDEAIALTRRGADVERPMNEYGLSRGEADLLSLVHGRRA